MLLRPASLRLWVQIGAQRVPPDQIVHRALLLASCTTDEWNNVLIEPEREHWVVEALIAMRQEARGQ